MEVYTKNSFLIDIIRIIGSNLVERFFDAVLSVKNIYIDNINDYYDVLLKKQPVRNFFLAVLHFLKGNIGEKAIIKKIFAEYIPDVVENQAVQPGVRYFITNLNAILKQTFLVFITFWKLAVIFMITVIRGSNSSVYGFNKEAPHSTDDKVDNTVSFYAVTKKSN